MQKYRITFRCVLGSTFRENFIANTPAKAIEQFYEEYDARCEILKIKKITQHDSLDIGYGFCLGIGVTLLLIIVGAVLGLL